MLDAAMLVALKLILAWLPMCISLERGIQLSKSVRIQASTQALKSEAKNKIDLQMQYQATVFKKEDYRTIQNVIGQRTNDTTHPVYVHLCGLASFLNVVRAR